jgi:magnesium chelatase family protein
LFPSCRVIFLPPKPAAGGRQPAGGGEIEVLAPPTLLALINHFMGSQVLTPPKPKLAEALGNHFDLKDIMDQETAKSALEVAAVGRHDLLPLRPP